MSFLQTLALRLRADYGSAISDMAIVLPSRRAVAFLRTELAAAYSQTIWSPRIYAIQDFVRELSGWQFPEALALNYQLYTSYKKVITLATPDVQPQSFEKFYAWGEMLLRDFDEIDRYRVDAKQLFTNVRDLREIDDAFGLPEEAKAAIRQFWGNVIEAHGEANTDNEEISAKKFLRIWELLYDIYEDFRAELSATFTAYDGMAYRHLARRMEENSLPLPYPTVIFAGFNALSTAEEDIFHALLTRKQAAIFWDADVAMMKYSHVSDEAGWTFDEPAKFIRYYHKKWKNEASYLIQTDVLHTPKNIQLISVPTQSAQAQYLGNLLGETHIEPSAYRSHAIVLADEQLLFPVLYSLPKEIDTLNITMGFQLRQTHVFGVLMGAMRLLRSAQVEDNQLVFTYQDVLSLLENAYIKGQRDSGAEKLAEDIIAKNLLFVEPQILAAATQNALLKHIFTPPAMHISGWLRYIEVIFEMMMSDAQVQQAAIEAEYAYHLYKRFNGFRDILNTFEQQQLSVSGFARLFREAMQGARIPFEGDPLIGLQLMGFLETRVLDFDNLYILGCNEGNLPASAQGNSFIPHSLRVAFKLPTAEQQETIYGYHFFRLLQRAKNVYLLYNTNIKDLGKAGEISRYLRQIRYFWRNSPTLQLSEVSVSSPTSHQKQAAISFAHDAEIAATLRERYTETHYLSPSALHTYLRCSLQFYFKYIKKLKETEEIEESMAANTFGTRMHEVLERLYQPYIEAKLTETLLQSLWGEVETMVDAVCAENALVLRGKNIILRNVIVRLCKNIIEHDISLLEEEPFVVAAIESDAVLATSMAVDGVGDVRLNGKVDRMDFLPEKDEYRILDYKTGNVKLAATVAAAFAPNSRKEAFQGYLYAYMHHKNHPFPASMGYYVARDAQNPIHFLKEKEHNTTLMPPEVLQAVEKHLLALLTRLFSEDFTQTHDHSICAQCSYSSICAR